MNCPNCKGDGFTGCATDPEPDFCQECSGSGEVEPGTDDDAKANHAYAEGRADEAAERVLRMDLLEAENARLRALLGEPA
jgi:hypothetical protein